MAKIWPTRQNRFANTKRREIISEGDPHSSKGLLGLGAVDGFRETLVFALMISPVNFGDDHNKVRIASSGCAVLIRPNGG
jgi:hypothetical protein